MRLGQLTRLMEEYDNTLYLRKLVYGDHERAKKLRNFLSTFKQGNDYILKASEQFQLALILNSVGDDLLLIRQFKRVFTNSIIFFELFSCLMQKNLVDEHNFEEIHASREKIDALYRLFCVTTFKPANITKKILETVLIVFKKNSLSNDIEACFGILSSKNLINDEILRLIERNATYLFLLLELIRELDKS